MYCVRCGREMEETAAFCPGCGTPTRSPQRPRLMPAESRIAGHIRLLGILWLALSAFRMVPGFVLAVMLDSHFPFGPDTPPFVPALLHVISVVFLVGGGIGILTGIGLLTRQSWARMLAIIVACVGLMDVPLGTALGVYTLWVLLPAHSEEEYREITRAAEHQPIA